MRYFILSIKLRNCALFSWNHRFQHPRPQCAANQIVFALMKVENNYFLFSFLIVCMSSPSPNNHFGSKRNWTIFQKKNSKVNTSEFFCIVRKFDLKLYLSKKCFVSELIYAETANFMLKWQKKSGYLNFLKFFFIGSPFISCMPFLKKNLLLWCREILDSLKIPVSLHHRWNTLSMWLIW